MPGRNECAPLFRRTAIVVAPARTAPPTGTALRQVLVTIVLTAMAMAAVLGLADMRTSQVAAEAVRTDVAVVRTGETLSQFATRVVPGSPVESATARIVELNALANGTVTAGRKLIVPAVAGK
ncbi:LysM peptidoglycan-binding domain-containing protein [Rhodococcus chondri]|uniref:LysM peptidoglycan-binding domain-containing protein n=1 Tax=Rhodococcus chondri TaxID=3065941 RepID=A0ABU7JSM4_9NOCA|nr:LysM peptidoglycan-binding domain-containing protein [Rhodococcus sp. CC-R104]MEE2032767.1 LysM peptidoglycan-binding domain-containing protein [Rhodococcus sp. CC-R104]